MRLEAEAFLQRIRAYPDDDTPRLIYADWLEEQCGETDTQRARFIRVQISLNHLMEGDAKAPHTRDAAWAELLAAERELFEAYREEWTAPFRGLATGLEFRRGFVEEVKVATRQFIGRAHELFATGPIRHIHLLDVGGNMPAVLQCQFLSRLNGLTVYAQHAGEPLAGAICRSPLLANLRLLHLGRNRFQDDAANHLAGSPILGNLEELDLSGNELGETGARALAASVYFGKLRRLELKDNRLGPGGAETLGNSERLTALERLGLSGNEVGNARLQSLTRMHELLRVAHLDLSNNGLNAAGLQTILSRPHRSADTDSPTLIELDLSHNELATEGMRLLAACPQLTRLRILRLAGCGIDDTGAQALAASPYLKQLTFLDLGNNPIGDPGFRAFLDSPHLGSLRKLIAPGIGVSDRMQRALNMRFHQTRD